MDQNVQTGQQPSGQANPLLQPEASGETWKGVLTELARLPADALLNESAMARIFGVVNRTIRRMVIRHELPPPIRVAGKSMWFAGLVLAHLRAKAELAAKAEEKKLAKLRLLEP